MSWLQIFRSLGARRRMLRATATAPSVPATPAALDAPRRWFVGIGGRPHRVTVSPPAHDPLPGPGADSQPPLDDPRVGLPLRGLAKVDGRWIALHEVDRFVAREAQPEDRPAVTS